MFSALSIFSGPYALIARWGVMAIACAAIYGVGWVRGHHSAELEFERFKGAAEALGKAAEERAAFRIAKDKANKETVDENYKVTISNLRATADRLRRERAAGGGLSSPATVADSVNGACFDPAKLDAALRRLDEGVLGIVESGEKAVISLDAAKEWALKMSPTLAR